MARRGSRLDRVVTALWLTAAFSVTGGLASRFGGSAAGRDTSEFSTIAPRVDTGAAVPPASVAGAPQPQQAAAAGASAADPTADRQPGWTVRENQREGTDAWQIASTDHSGYIEGYAASTSAHPGDAVALMVSTAAPQFTVEAYRMGYYGGKRGRLVWTSPVTDGAHQPAPVVDRTTGRAEARWATSLTMTIGAEWLPGAYLLKLVSSAGDQSYIPLTVGDTAAHADVTVVDAVATWQAYNLWGGCSLYECHGVKGRARAVEVSFDRPYAEQYGHGAADFADHELPLIALVEQLGIDAQYVTSIDLHEHPELASSTAATLSLGHDEYYSANMRTALVDARAHGTNLAFFGANAVYRHIRFTPSSAGMADRVEVDYRSNADPVRAHDPADTTVEWRSQGKPEAALVGVQYRCANVQADLVVADASHWVWAGAGVHDHQKLHDLVGNEADGVDRSASPSNIELLSRSPIHCGGDATSSMSYYSAPSGAGVFATGTIWWVCALDAQSCSVPANIAPVTAATTNVLRAFAAGPAGAAHPSSGSRG